MVNLNTLIEKRYKIAVCIFFAAYLCLGISIFKDYGISWDEHFSRTNGMASLAYITKTDQGRYKNFEPYHGAAFEIVLAVFEKALNFNSDLRQIFFIRHFFTFLLFYIGVFFFYKLCKHRFKSWRIGLLGSLFLILSPRIFADSFYNSKDIAFLSLFIISIYTLIGFLDKKTVPRAFIHALSSAFLIDIRVLGIIVPFLTAVFFIADLLIINSERDRLKKNILSLFTYGLLSVFFTVLFWPLLWTKPLYHFIEAFRQMSQIPWEGSVLYLGKFWQAKNLPWHYTFLWIIISTPVLYIVCFFIGCLISAIQLLRNPLLFYSTKRNDLIFLFWVFLPLASIILLHLVLFDAWRHLFFVYPALIMFSLFGLITLFKYIKLKLKRFGTKILNLVLALIISCDLFSTVYFMAKYHPFQNVYFNIFAAKDANWIKNNFELDYWGLSYKKALEYILKNDSNRVIRVCVANPPGEYNADILFSDTKKTLLFVNKPEEANYFLSNYRWHREDYPFKNEYYSIKVNGLKIMVVYKLK